jgi:hypothetical protein
MKTYKITEDQLIVITGALKDANKELVKVEVNTNTYSQANNKVLHACDIIGAIEKGQN